MARTTESSSTEEREPSSPSSELTIIEAIQKIAHYNANAELDNEHHLMLFLKSWWSRLYNRPLKDPLLDSYTLEELLYEFYDKQERELAAEVQVEQDTDRIDTKKVQENLDWAEEEERKELEALKARQEKGETVPDAINPLEDPENKKWMEEQIKRDLELAKETFGSDFGEDIDEDFNG